MQSQDYDAIVVGSGISGGWAAKELAEKVRGLVERVAQLPATPLAEGDAPPTVTTDPGRAISIARTDLQTGFMWLIRSIARPTTF